MTNKRDKKQVEGFSAKKLQKERSEGEISGSERREKKEAINNDRELVVWRRKPQQK